MIENTWVTAVWRRIEATVLDLAQGYAEGTLERPGRALRLYLPVQWRIVNVVLTGDESIGEKVSTAAAVMLDFPNFPEAFDSIEFDRLGDYKGDLSVSHRPIRSSTEPRRQTRKVNSALYHVYPQTSWILVYSRRVSLTVSDLRDARRRSRTAWERILGALASLLQQGMPRQIGVEVQIENALRGDDYGRAANALAILYEHLWGWTGTEAVRELVRDLEVWCRTSEELLFSQYDSWSDSKKTLCSLLEPNFPAGPLQLPSNVELMRELAPR